jgi:hypothetical protein
MNTRSPRLPLALLTILVVFAAAAPAAAIQVTRGAREVTAVYAQLHRAGLRVTIARPFTLRSDAATVVQSIFPPAGTSVRRGATVKLTVSCCRRTTTRVAPTASLLPSLLGYGASTANTWASSRHRRLVVTLGGLRAGGASQLLDNYLVGRQSPAAGRVLIGRQPLRLSARQGTPGPCLPPLYAIPVIHDTLAEVSAVPNSDLKPADPAPGGTFFGCVYKTNRQVRLVRAFVGPNQDFALLHPAIAGTEFAAVTATGGGKYGSAPHTFGIQTYNLATGKTTRVYDAGPSLLDRVVVNSIGFTAWHQVTGPATPSTPFTDVSCPNANMCVAVDNGGSVFTTTSPSDGRGAWSQTQLAGASTLSGVSCASPTLCVAVSGPQVFVSTNPAGGADAWTATAVPGANLQGVACQSASLCVAVGDNGVATSTDPTSGPLAWTFGPVAGATGLLGVACPSASLCVASDNKAGNILSSTNPSGGAATWSSANVDGSQGLSGVGCASSSLCVATDFAGDVLTSTNPAGGLPAWQLSHVVNTPLTRVSCPSVSLCVAGSLNGVATSTNPTGGSGAWSLNQISGGNGIQGLSCPTTSLCVAVNAAGQITTSGNPTGGSSAWGAATVDAPVCAVSAGCATEQILAHDSSGTHSLDGTGPGSGKQLQGLTLAGDLLTWTHDGAAESTTLG